MANTLENLIKAKIKADGPMSISEYMALCLGHPEYGYYMTRDPFGVKGDFTTAPEVSQMFGELIGAWVMQVWHDMGEPEHFNLIEAGPGRGTLMQDMLRISCKNPQFKRAVTVGLIETSPHLRAIQKKTLAEYSNIAWHDTISDIELSGPAIFVANELLDALPIHQFIKIGDNHWHERAVGINDNQELIITERHPSFDPRLILPSEEIDNGTIVEICPVAQSLVKDVAEAVKEHRGAALFIDYGYSHRAYGDTFQAMKDQKFVDVLHKPGDCDLTAHVNFERLFMVAQQSEVICAPIVSQSEFLKNLGIELRANMLKTQNPEMADGIDRDLNRLIGDDEMGSLFKVLGLCHPDLKIAGFENVYL